MSGGVVEEMTSALPAPVLRPLIGHYTGYRQQNVAPAVHRGLPSPYLTLIFTLDDPLVVSAHPDPGQPAGRFETLVGGLHTGPALITHDGSQSGVQLALDPLAARTLLGLPAGAFYALDLPAQDLLGPKAGEIQDRLREAGSWPERFAVLDRVLAGRAASARVSEPAPEVVRAWHLLRAGGGAVPIARVAHDIGWSARHLGLRFTAEFGLSPKAAARMIRFDRARRLIGARLAAGRTLDLAGVSARCGYFDQAHLARDFRGLAGCSPSVWAREEIRNVQAHSSSIEAG